MTQEDRLAPLPRDLERELLVQRLGLAAVRARATDADAAVLRVDLGGRVAAVNDQYGHDRGDQLLRAVAGRLATMLRPGDTLARMSDGFVVLCEDLESGEDAHTLALRLVDGLEQPFLLPGRGPRVAADPDDATDVEPLELRLTASVRVYFAAPADAD